MKQIHLIGIVSFLLVTSCQKEKITLGLNVSETFYLDNNHESMRVLVEGNTLSHVFLIFVHGGPGASSYFYNTDYISQNIEDKYAVVYMDQRNAGASQGNSNAKYLSLAQMTDDLKKVILVLKSRYGQNSSIFILGHSFGGLLTTSFMTTGNYQTMVKGWIFVDGSHNYPLNDSLTRQKLLTIGQQQIALNKYADKWIPIVSYCNDHPGNFTFEESEQLSTYAEDAEEYFDQIKKIDYVALAEENIINDNWPVTSMLFNYLYTIESGFDYDLYTTRFSNVLYKVTTPTILLFGQFDFICPQELGVEILNRINTTDKTMVISPISGHYMMFQDEAFFCNQVNNFIALHK